MRALPSIHATPCVPSYLDLPYIVPVSQFSVGSTVGLGYLMLRERYNNIFKSGIGCAHIARTVDYIEPLRVSQFDTK